MCGALLWQGIWLRKLYEYYKKDTNFCAGEPDAEALQEEFAGRMPKVLKTEPEGGTDIRIRSCSSCGKLLSVREEKDAFVSECNNCGIRYSQKK